MNETLVIWVGALVTLAVFSYLARDNPVYRIVQHAALGSAVGIGLVVLWRQVLYPRWALPIADSMHALGRALAGEGPAEAGQLTGLLWILALVPGSLWYFQLSRKWVGLSTLITGLFVGAAAGLAIKNQILLTLPQVSASIRPLGLADADGHVTAASVATWANNIVFLVMLLAALLYFFFTIPTGQAVLRGPLRLGRLTIMLCLGGLFGGTVMTRVAYLLERLTFLREWLIQQVPRAWGG